MINLLKNGISIFVGAVLFASLANAASNNSVDMLRYIPADAPYAFASTEALPKDVAAKFEPTLDAMFESYRAILRQLAAESKQSVATVDNGEHDHDDPFSEELIEELLALLSVEGMRGVGIERESAYAMYGNGLLPVLRVELSDSDLFIAAVDRIEEKAASSLLVGEAKGQPYRYLDADKMHLIIATLDDQLVVTLVPTTFAEKEVAAALGITKPRQSLKMSKTLRAINKQYDFSEFLTGFVDVQRIVGIFSGHATDHDEAVFKAFGEGLPELDASCAAEALQMASVAPRMIFGYREISTERISGAVVVEMREDIAAGLATLSTAVPGLGTSSDGLMSFGLGMNPLALRDFVAARVGAVEENPYQCEMFASIEGAVAGAREMLQQPIPPVAYSLRGLVAVVDALNGFDPSKGDAPESVDGSVLLAMENAESLLMMASMMDPSIAALELAPDSKPVSLAGIEALADYANDAFAAMSENALSVSTGADANSNVVGMLQRDVLDPSPIFSINVDAFKYYELLGAAMEGMGGIGKAGDSETTSGAKMHDAVLLSVALYERLDAKVWFTQRGIEVDTYTTLRD